MDKYIKWMPVLIFLSTSIGGYFVLQYKVDMLITNVSATQNTLSDIIVDIAVIKAKLEAD